jgi:hypothetical protein
MSKSFVVAVAFLVAALDCGDEIVRDVIAIASVKFTVKRIAGAQYFTLDKGDSKDGSSSQSGVLCVTHNPGCGWVGNNGSDKFFTPDKPLPALATIVAVHFTQFWPVGIASQSAGGGLGGWGSYGANISNGSPDGSVPTTVHWNNACQGVFGGKDVVYRISFLISVPEGTDLGEPMFDQSEAEPPDLCQPPGYSPMPQGGGGPPQFPPPSGWSGVVSYCNVTDQPAAGALQLTATVVTPLPNAQGSSAMMVTNLPVTFGPSGGGVPSTASFTTPSSFKQGTWQITQAKVLGLTGNLPGLPLTAPLPGAPLLAFNGATCVR